MEAGEKLTLEQIRALLEATGKIQFAGQNRDEIYEWVTQMLCYQEYFRQRRPIRGLLRQYAARMTGLSRAQVTRLIGRYRGCGEVKATKYRRHGFARRFTHADIALLAAVDEAHETLSGPATKRILEREFQQYGKAEYERLSTLSTGHLYNLRKTRAYRHRRVHFEATHSISIPIGERRCPKPEGKQGYLRVDTFHQGDRDGEKGLYHINAVDEVTQWQIIGATSFISEVWLMPLRSSDLAHLDIDILPHFTGKHANPPGPHIHRFFLFSIVRRKRKDSVPVSMMCARSVIRSNSALHNRGFGNTVVHSENGKLVVTMIAARSARSEITWKRNSAPMSASGT